MPGIKRTLRKKTSFLKFYLGKQKFAEQSQRLIELYSAKLLEKQFAGFQEYKNKIFDEQQKFMQNCDDQNLSIAKLYSQEFLIEQLVQSAQYFVHSQENIIREITKEKEKSKKELDQISQKLKNYDKLNIQQKEEYSQQINKLQKAYEEGKTQYKRQITNLEEQIKSLQTENERLQTKIKTSAKKEERLDNYILKSTYDYKIEHVSNELNKKTKQIQEMQNQKASMSNEINQLQRSIADEKKINNQLLQLISNGMKQQSDDNTAESKNKLIETNFNLTNTLQSVQNKLKDSEQKIKELKKKQKIAKYASMIQCKFCYELFNTSEFVEHLYECQGKNRKLFMCSEVFADNKSPPSSFTIENQQFKIKLDKINYQHFPYHNSLEVYCELEVTSKLCNESWKLTKSLSQFEQLTKSLNNNQILQFYLSSPNNFQKNKIALENTFIKNEHFLISYLDQLLSLTMVNNSSSINNFFEIQPQLLSLKRFSQPAASLTNQFRRLETTPDFMDSPIIEEPSRLLTPRDQNTSISFRANKTQTQQQFKKIYQINYEKILEKRRSLNASSQQKNQLAKLIPQTERNYKMVTNQKSSYRSIPKKQESTNVTLQSNNYNPENSINSNYSSCKFTRLLKTKVQNYNNSKKPKY